MVAIACGGTGGHLFPGRAVAEELLSQGCQVTLLVSPKGVDQAALGATSGMEVMTLPAVGLSWSSPGAFVRGFRAALGVARRRFRECPPRAVLTMGSFTGAPTVLAGKLAGAATFLHESNALPGRANRWLARIVDLAFVGFPQAASRLRARRVETIGTPVRSSFRPACPEAARQALGLEARRPVLLVMGGSQGASGVNEIVVRSLALLKTSLPDLQFLHLTGPGDFEKVRAAYRAQELRPVVRPFLTEMELALDAATVAVSRAGASTLAELAAMRLPAVLIPYPFATANHQFHNARIFVESGAARMLTQPQATPELFVQMLRELIADEGRRESMKSALARWHRPEVAARIAQRILEHTHVSPAPAARPLVAHEYLPPARTSDVNS